jgi:cysteinyl-tRNA synthetase
MLYGDDGDDKLYGEEGNDQIWGGAGADYLYGGAGDDRLYGDAGDDHIFGGAGSDTMTGGAGKDYFYFDTALDGQVDKITDFSAKEDKLVLSKSIFTSLSGLSSVSADNLVIGSKAQDANDFLIYNKGVLYYDADGSGSGAAVAIATLTGNPSLTFSSFLLI